MEPARIFIRQRTCHGATPAVWRSMGSKHCRRMLSMNTGWPRTISSPKLTMYFSSSLQAVLQANLGVKRQRCSPLMGVKPR